ncbi:UPF0699 transmembrane protein YdbS [Caldalkalibacillus thermarum]|uniref:PH domain-containing protein n=1 Tax=Caldalkalibacillus thermarum TaxID=296745 RepID=UPI001662D30F|nr:PH domain-containing protein [Caldalkalibacillus thermarum]GGK27735.1 UPF0699 transmembrane protein YdbS [Caldalkalibacillus thermarum]
MRPEPTQRIDKKALTVWRISGSLMAALYWIAVLIYYVLYSYLSLPPQFSWLLAPWLLWILLLTAAVMSIVHIGIVPAVRWKRWRYEVNEYEIDLKHGVLVVKRTLIPMIRVQHVDTRQGPLLRYFGLSSVTINTAGGLHEIPALQDTVADALRDRISVLAREAKEDV